MSTTRPQQPGSITRRCFCGTAAVALLPTPAVAQQVPKYLASVHGRPVLRIADEPGLLTSRVLPTPGMAPVRHPFLTATALDPMEEDRLRAILDASRSTLDFLARLRTAGYEVTRLIEP